MNPAEQRELNIWGGAGAAVVLIGGIYLWMNSDTDALQAEEASGLHERYSGYYLEPAASAIPESKAKQVALSLFDQQIDQEQRAFDTLVFPGRGIDGIPPEFANSQFHVEWQGARQDHKKDAEVRPYFTDLISYAEANGIVSEVNKRIKNQAKRLGVELRAGLPFASGKSIDPANLSLMTLQLAKVCSYAMLATLVLDANVAQIDRIDFSQGGGAWCDPSKSYATLVTRMDISCTYQQADLILKAIERNRHGLALHDVHLVQNKDKNFTMRLSGSLTVPYRDDWNLPIKTPRQAGRKGTPSKRKTVEGTTEVRRDSPPPADPPPANNNNSGSGLRPNISTSR